MSGYIERFNSNGGIPIEMWIDDDGELFISFESSDVGLDPADLAKRLTYLIARSRAGKDTDSVAKLLAEWRNGWSTR